MAGNIKGITIEFNGDTTRLDKALRKVKGSTKEIDSELRQVDRDLKFNPTSVTLWRQKQQLLNDKISQTERNVKELKDVQKQMDTQGVDKNSEAYRRVQREIVEAESKLKNFKKKLTEVGNVRLTALGEQFKQVGKKMTEVGKDLTTKVTLPLTLLGGEAAKKFAEVDKTMVLTNSTMDNTAEEAELLNKAMKEAAANSTFGMSDAATASLNFARAGLDAEQAASALAPAMALAAGEGGNLDTVSGGLVATINGFHGSFEDAGKYADVFANACNNSALDVDSLSNAMSVAAPIFASAGYSVEDAALYMGVMANNGIGANKAANSLKTGLARLVSPSKDAAKTMKKLGINVTNADGSMKDSVEIQEELHEAFSGLSESEQIAAASSIFGKNQMSAWLSLINTAPEDVADLSDELTTNGTAMKMQADQMSGFAGSIEKLKSGVDVLMTSLGEALAPIIEKVVDKVQQLVDWFNSLSPHMQTVIATIGVVAAAIGPVLLILGTLASAIGSIISLIGSVGTVIGALAGPVGIAIAIIAALVAAGIALYKNWDTVKAKAIELKDKVVGAFTQFRDKVKAIWENIKTTITGIWDKVKTTVSSTADAIKNKVAGVFSGLKETVSNIWDGIKTAITHPIETALDLVGKAIEKMKDIINFADFKFPHIKLPHFGIKGEFSLNPPQVPKLAVDWYKTGGIFDQASVIGVGEAGPEAVVPLDTLWKKLDNIANATASMQMGAPTIVINATPGMDVKAVAREVEKVLINNAKSNRLVWG